MISQRKIIAFAKRTQFGRAIIPILGFGDIGLENFKESPKVLLDRMRSPFPDATARLGLIHARLPMSQKSVGRPSPRGKPFEKGHKKIGGRRAGTPNRATVILQKAAQLGSRDEIVALIKEPAVRQPAAFLRLLAKVFPKRPGSVRGSRTR